MIPSMHLFLFGFFSYFFFFLDMLQSFKIRKCPTRQKWNKRPGIFTNRIEILSPKMWIATSPKIDPLFSVFLSLVTEVLQITFRILKHYLRDNTSIHLFQTIWIYLRPFKSFSVNSNLSIYTSICLAASVRINLSIYLSVSLCLFI